MITPTTHIPARTTVQSLGKATSECFVIGGTYLCTAFFATTFICFCGPGCYFAFYSILAGVSGFLMLRQARLTRVVCLAMLLLFLYGMWYEKEVRDT